MPYSTSAIRTSTAHTSRARTSVVCPSSSGPAHQLSLASVLGLSLLIAGCTNTDDPQLAMCQAVAKQLTDNTIADWGSIDQSDTARVRTINIAFERADSTQGNVKCNFPIDLQGVTESAPNAIVLDGRRVGTQEMLSAGLKASGELLKGTAANTVAKSKELAGEARDKAGEMASDMKEKAREAALETTKSLQQQLEK